MSVQTQRRAVWQILSRSKAAKTFDLAVLLLEIYFTHTSHVENVVYGDIYDNILIAETGTAKIHVNQRLTPFIMWFTQIIE